MKAGEFRIWDKLNQYMLYPKNGEFKDKRGTILDVYINGAKDLVDSNGDLLNTNWYILMEYLGFKDKSGNRVFDKDFLDFDEKEWGGKFEPEIIERKGVIGDWNYCGSFNDVKEWRKVVGNLYENPELLK